MDNIFDIENAKEYIDNSVQALYSARGNGRSLSNIIIAGYLEEASLALDKQIPKHPINYPKNKSNCLCPRCSHPVSMSSYAPYTDYVSYCSNCGQKLDWREENPRQIHIL